MHSRPPTILSSSVATEKKQIYTFIVLTFNEMHRRRQIKSFFFVSVVSCNRFVVSLAEPVP